MVNPIVFEAAPVFRAKVAAVVVFRHRRGFQQLENDGLAGIFRRPDLSGWGQVWQQYQRIHLEAQGRRSRLR